LFSLAKRAFEIAKKAKEFIFRKMEIRGDELKWPLNSNIGGEDVKIEEIKKRRYQIIRKSLKRNIR